MAAATKRLHLKSEKEGSRRDSKVNKGIDEGREPAFEFRPPTRKSNISFVASRKDEYQNLIFQIRQIVAEFLPAEATVLVVNKGDGELLRLEGRQAWHFPCTESGDYACHYPADSAEAINHLEQLRAKGADHILFPATAFWWLDFYAGFRRHLESHYVVVAREETTCMIYGLRNMKPARNASDAESWLDGSDKPLATVASEPSLTADLTHASDDYGVHFELAKRAWQQGRLDEVEQRLTRLTQLYPSDAIALIELVKFYCVLIENGRPEKPRLSRFLPQIADPDKMRRLPPDVNLLVAESLGASGESELALASLDAALGSLNFGSETLQNFTLRLLPTIATTKSAIPFDDKISLAAFLTHAGNSFAAVHDYFKSEACYHLAIAADSAGWNSGSWAAHFNLAFNEMARGNPIKAQHYLAGASRLGPEKTAAIVWPQQNGMAWPRAAFDLTAAFEKRKPANVAWPKITVITPSLNQAEYVEETLLSVLNQNYPALEYIVVDNESTDGTIDILKRYEAQLSRLIIEPDEGQADAINKGLRISAGEIVLWLNSDDLLGPGSLFNIALTFLTEKADIIYGFCCEHTERRFGVINLPAVTPATFNVECLGDIFNYWLKGHYFYQPEVAFSRRILEKAGGSLAKELHYTMDYEFWLRCARAGASLAAVHWPIGFFRKHDKQKTTHLDPTIIEQARVRDRFVLLEPGSERKLEIKQRLNRAFSKPVPEVSIVSTRASEMFSPDTARALREKLIEDGLSVTFHSEIESLKPGKDDLVIVLMNLFKEHEALRKLREAGHDGLMVGWLWNNHHRVFENSRAAADLDICIPGHGFASSYLRSSQYLMEQPVPLCVTQWTTDEAHSLFEKHGGRQRHNALDGRFVHDRLANKRSALVEQLCEGSEAVRFLDEHTLESYFGLSTEERFQSWASYKASICISGELSQNFFDALLTGQIPLVPDDMHDLDEVIPRELQEELPVVRFSEYTVAAVEQAHSLALQLFDRDGEAGALRRHQFALKNHMFESGIRTIVSEMRIISSFAKTEELDDYAERGCKWQ